MLVQRAPYSLGPKHAPYPSLGLLVGRLSGPTLHLVVERLAAQALKEGTESAQEDAALGLKTVIAAVPADQGPQLAAYLSPKLTEGLASKVGEDAGEGDGGCK